MSAILKPVKSSYIDAIGHDPSANQLQVKFKDGSMFIYDDVPAKVHADMLKSDSIGSFFHTKVKTNFTGKKLDTPKK